MNKSLVCLIHFIFRLIVFAPSKSQAQLDDPWLNISQIIASRGFIPQIHRIVTEDGYILTLHRIVNPFIPPIELPYRKPVLFLCGALMNAKGYLVHTKGSLLFGGIYVEDNGRLITNCNPGLDGRTNTKTHPFVLSSCGFDVWLGDTRGMGDSMQHIHLSYLNFKYWQFSFQEIGWFDYPAMIGHILLINHSGSINLIALSQTTTALMFYLTSQTHIHKPINLAILTAPAVFTRNVPDQIPILAPIAPLLRSELVLPWLRLMEMNIRLYGGPIPVRFFPDFLLVTAGYAAQKLQQFLSTFGIDILSVMEYLFPPVVSSINSDQTAAYITMTDNTCAYISSHLMQTFITGRFTYHDRGISQNIRLYGEVNAPDVPLEIITTRIALFHGDEDLTANPNDITMLKTRLKIYHDYLIPLSGWKHLDYITHKNVDQFILPQYLYLLKTTN